MVTNISAVSSETDTNVITIGHLDEVHYVSTVSFNEQAMAFNVICNNQPAQLATGCCRTTNSNEKIAVTKELESLFEGIHGNKEKKIMSSEISKTKLYKQRNQKILQKQKNFKGRHLIDAKNQILIILEN